MQRGHYILVGVVATGFMLTIVLMAKLTQNGKNESLVSPVSPVLAARTREQDAQMSTSHQQYSSSSLSLTDDASSNVLESSRGSTPDGERSILSANGPERSAATGASEAGEQWIPMAVRSQKVAAWLIDLGYGGAEEDREQLERNLINSPAILIALYAHRDIPLYAADLRVLEKLFQAQSAVDAEVSRRMQEGQQATGIQSKSDQVWYDLQRAFSDLPPHITGALSDTERLHYTTVPEWFRSL